MWGFGHRCAVGIDLKIWSWYAEQMDKNRKKSIEESVTDGGLSTIFSGIQNYT